MHVIVVGAGMAGLTAAGQLTRSGHLVTVVDKGRRVGGRMATRGFAGGTFDHGAQHFSARSPEFQELTQHLLDTGVVDVWLRTQSITHPDRGDEARHIGRRGMNSVAAALAAELDVSSGVAVDRLTASDSAITAHWVDGDLSADAAILTPPLPQAAALLATAGHDLPSELAAITYDACLAVLATLDGPAGIEDGHASGVDAAVAWIGDNQHKGISEVPAITIHSTPEFASAHLEEEPADWMPELVAAAGPHLGANTVATHGHRWRYSQPRNPVASGALWAADRIAIAGEALAGARIEGAFRSGLAAAELVQELA